MAPFPHSFRHFKIRHLAIKESTQNSKLFLQVSKTFGAKSEETNPETESMDGQAATVILTNTFYLAETTGWKHSYRAASNFESHSNPIACDPLSILWVCRASDKKKKKQDQLKTPGQEELKRLISS